MRLEICIVALSLQVSGLAPAALAEDWGDVTLLGTTSSNVRDGSEEGADEEEPETDLSRLDLETILEELLLRAQQLALSESDMQDLARERYDAARRDVSRRLRAWVASLSGENESVRRMAQDRIPLLDRALRKAAAIAHPRPGPSDLQRALEDERLTADEIERIVLREDEVIAIVESWEGTRWATEWTLSGDERSYADREEARHGDQRYAAVADWQNRHRAKLALLGRLPEFQQYVTMLYEFLRVQNPTHFILEKVVTIALGREPVLGSKVDRLAELGKLTLYVITLRGFKWVSSTIARLRTQALTPLRGPGPSTRSAFPKRWSEMSKAERGAFQHEYARKAGEMGLPRWAASRADELRAMFNMRVAQIRQGAQVARLAMKPVGLKGSGKPGKSQPVQLFEYTDQSGVRYYYYETVQGRFVSAGVDRLQPGH